MFLPVRRSSSGRLVKAAWDDCDFLMGHFNAKHDDWNPTLKPGNMHISDCHGVWLSGFCDRNGLRVHPPTGCTFRNISAIDLFIGRLTTRVSYDGKAGLEHVVFLSSRGWRWLSRRIWLEGDQPGERFRHPIVMIFWCTSMRGGMRRCRRG